MMLEKLQGFSYGIVCPYTVELWSLELACLEHEGLLELVRRSP